MNFKTRLKVSNNLVDLTPLVDVVFLMLIFFIITSDILPLKSLNVENPEIDRNSAPLTTQLIVIMDAQNVIYVGSKKEIVDLVGLKEFLQEELLKIGKQHRKMKPSIVLSVDRRVAYESFLRLFSVAQQCNVPVRLVYKPEEAQNAEYF